MSRQTPSLSFEVFPPNPAVGNDNIISALQDMQELAPHFISVTASNNKFNIKETTVRLADFIQNDLAIPTIAHLPAIYLTKDKVTNQKASGRCWMFAALNTFRHKLISDRKSVV